MSPMLRRTLLLIALTACTEAPGGQSECASNASICDANATCNPDSSGHGCQCNEFFRGPGTTCEGPITCAWNPCYPGVTCTDALPPAIGFTCGPCPAGTAGNGIMCDGDVSCG